MNEQGIIVGCDDNQEWLLPWWWDHYSAHNSFPVAFADFGMSERALSWCKERGTCLTLPKTRILTENEILPSEKERWERHYGRGVWIPRSAWFKKPLALLHSPFSTGIWLDLDCRVNGPLAPLFCCLDPDAEIGVLKFPERIQKVEQEQGSLLPREIYYCSGVIVFRKEVDILYQWSEEACINNGNYPGDQDALTRAIHLHRPVLIELPAIWNWSRGQGPNPAALIDHFAGAIGKLEIMKQIDPAQAQVIENLQTLLILEQRFNQT